MEVWRLKEEILEELNIKENHERECKLAAGGLPESIWETYSSFANTNGGTILLGIREYRDSFTVEGLTDKQIVKYQKDFWSTLNDRNKVSKNILLNHHVRPVIVREKKILRIDVPLCRRGSPCNVCRSERCVRRCGGAGRVWIRCAESGYDKRL